MATPNSNLDGVSDSQRNLAQETQPNQPTPGPEVAASPSDPARLRLLYSTMLRCRMIEERAAQLAAAGKLKSPPLLRGGHEATSIGSMIELRPGDAIRSEPSIAAHVICGVPLGLSFAEWYGIRSQYLAFAPEAANSTVHLIPPAATVAGQLNLAAGFALANKLEQRPNIVLVLLQDGVNALGFWHEAATLAAAERLPLIIVAVSELQNTADFGKSGLRERAAAYGIPGIAVDGNDVVAMWRVTQESIHRARGGAGPTLIDSQISVAQTRPNDSAGINDPLGHMQHYLEKRQLWDESWKRELVQKFAAEIDEAQSFLPRASGMQ